MPDIRNARDYALYEGAVAEFIARESIAHLSTGTVDYEHTEFDADIEDTGEPWFSWSPCECCGSSLGGNREYLYAYASIEGEKHTSFVQFTICEDCVYYVNYGRLDDATMARVEAA